MKRILVSKLRHHGDVLLASPVFFHLRRVYPGAEIVAYIYRETLPMLDGHPAIDRFILFDKSKRGAKQEWDHFRQLRGFDLSVNLTEGDRGAWAGWLSGAKVRVGYDPDKPAFVKKLYTHMVRPTQKPRHTVEKNLDALRMIGIFPDEHERDLFFHIPDEARLSALQKLQGISDFLLIHPVSRWMFKTWPTKKVIEVCKQIGGPIVVTASSDRAEMAVVEKIAEEVDVLNLAGQISLKELGALIEYSRMLLCVDSVPMHIASALKKPCVALFGPTSDKNWAPWKNPHARVVAQDVTCRPCYNAGCGGCGVSDCLETLPVENVLEAIYSLKSCPK